MGMRKEPGTHKSARFEIRMQPSIRTELEVSANATRRTVTSLIEEALEDIIKKYRGYSK